MKKSFKNFHQNFAELIEEYNDEYGTYIDMSQPREASYYAGEKRDEETKESIKVYSRLGEDVPLQSSNPSMFQSLECKYPIRLILILTDRLKQNIEQLH